jgi:D-arabinose 1-dehydrogenase-like Zn-dependent alcohol dehydrogenase/glycosyltransferase involved in cell wall biosynthesis
LPEVLAAIERQTYRNFEVLLVDSGSVDRTRDIAVAHGARIIRLRSEDFTFGHSLNLGIEEAQGSLIAILSAHAIPTDHHWLERLIEPLEQPDVAMVFGGQRGHRVSKFSEARDFERVFPSRPLVMDDDHVFVNNANSAIRRDLWEKHRFDEGLPGLEDAEWAKYWIPLGKRVLYEPAACIYHVHMESWAQVRHRFYREGIAGRWTAVRIIRHIPREVLQELYWGFLDLSLATLQGRVASVFGEILRYRYNKTVGIVKGILDSRVITNPSKRAELQFDKGFAAVVIRGHHSAAIEPRSIPPLKPSEVLVRVAYEGICRTDVEIFEGRLGHDKIGKVKYPIVPGHELSGTVVALGKKVVTFTVGDRVAVESIQGCGACDDCQKGRAISCRERREVGMEMDGGYAEYVVTRARYVHKVPGDVTLAQAALTEPLAMVIKALGRLEASASFATGRHCAVVGAGTMGHLAAKVLALRKHAVTVFDKDLARLALLEGAVQTEPSLTALGRFEWFIEATGDPEVLATLLQQSPARSMLLVLGRQYGHQSVRVGSIAELDKTVVGSAGSSGADFEEALATLPHLDTNPLLQCTYPLEEFARGWRAVRSRAHIKAMLRVDSDAI